MPRVPGLNTDVQALTSDVVGGFRRNGLANFAGAMAFREMLALIPFLLFLLSLLGFFDLQEVWKEDVAPEVEQNASEAAFKLVDDTVRQVLSQKQVWWLTVGLVLTVWELSAITRVTITALDRIYGYHRRRGLVEVLPRSLWLGVAMACAWSRRSPPSASARCSRARCTACSRCCPSSSGGCSPRQRS